MLLSSMFKGWIGEVQGTIAKKLFLDGDVYTDINNVTIPTDNGTTQIDHVIVSRYGIFVVAEANGVSIAISLEQWCSGKKSKLTLLNLQRKKIEADPFEFTLLNLV